MKASTSHKLPPARPRPRGRGRVVLAALALLAGAIALFLALRGAGPTASRGHGAAAARGSYRNRAVVAPAGAPTPPLAERPAIRGNVYDPEGNLLAGATLDALTYDVAGNMASKVGTVRSAEDGTFTIPLAEGTYQLNVSGEGFGPTSVVAHTGDTVSVVLPPSGTLTGHVVDEKGKPVRRFTIDLVSAVPGDAPAPPPLWSKAFDSKDGAFEVAALPAWPVVVRASADDLAPGFSPPVQLRSIDTQEITITLNAGCALAGTVVDKQGRPLPQVLVDAEERLTAGSLTDPVLQASTQAVTGSDGSFRLDHVPRATVMVRGYDGDNAATSITVDARDCAHIAPVKLVMSPGGAVEGTARRADGTPIPGARVGITERAVGIVNTVADAEGRFRFDDLPAGVFRVELDHEGQSALKMVQVHEGDTAHLDLSLFAEGSGGLEGKVMAGGRPLAGARLLVASNRGRAAGVSMYFPVTGTDGSFRVPRLPPGAYLVSVMSTPAGTGVEVKKDETAEVSIDVSSAYAVRAPAADVPPPRPHARRLQERRRQAQDPQGGETPEPAAPVEDGVQQP